MEDNLEFKVIRNLVIFSVRVHNCAVYLRM